MLLIIPKFGFPATMVWLVNMADTDGPSRNSTDAAPPHPEAQAGGLVSACGLQGRTQRCLLTSVL